MAHQYLNDGEEEEVRSRPAEEPESMTGAPEETPAAEASSAADESSTSMAPRRQRRSKSESSQGAAEATTEATTEPKTDETPEVAAVSPREADLQDLEARGFTEDEATRLIELSAHINEATLKRLQFTKWLVEQGLLDEFSLRD
jgi:hypothetical protein